MVVYHAGGLHMGINNGAAYKLKAALFKVFAYGV
jgi:hypothetical protein